MPAILLSKPIVATYLNQSPEDFMAETIRRKNEINGIGNKFDQAVKKLHTLDQISEFKSWVTTYEIDSITLSDKVEESKNHIEETGEQWLH
jgi:hypothetical protein